MSRPAFMTLDFKALQENLSVVRTLAPNSAVLAMVKANAYGHGAAHIAKALSSVDAFGVASLEEGLQLRKAGVAQPIVLVEGVFYPDELPLVSEHQFTLVVHHEKQIAM